MSPPRPNSIPRFGEQVWAEQRYPLTPSEWRYLATCGDDLIERLTLARPDVPPEIVAEAADAAADARRTRAAEASKRELAAARAEAAQLRAELAALEVERTRKAPTAPPTPSKRPWPDGRTPPSCPSGGHGTYGDIREWVVNRPEF